MKQKETFPDYKPFVLKFGNTPTPKQLAFVTDNQPFQNPSCLLECIRPSNFASVSWDKKVNSCSY